jgi:hypothetical protein
MYLKVSILALSTICLIDFEKFNLCVVFFVIIYSYTALENLYQCITYCFFYYYYGHVIITINTDVNILSVFKDAFNLCVVFFVFTLLSKFNKHSSNCLNCIQVVLFKKRLINIFYWNCSIFEY